MRPAPLLLAALALLATAPAAGEPPLVLELCEGQVASAEVLAPPAEGGSYAVAVRLAPEAAAGFEALTRDHVGRPLEIRLGPGHVVRAPIRAPVRSGLVTAGGFATRAEAEAARDAALASRERPCRAPAPDEDEAPAATTTPAP